MRRFELCFPNLHTGIMSHVLEVKDSATDEEIERIAREIVCNSFKWGYRELKEGEEK